MKIDRSAVIHKGNSKMKRTGINIGLIFLSICLAGISFELLVYLGTKYLGIYWIVRYCPDILLAVLLLFWLRVLWINLSGRQYYDILAVTVVRGPADLTLEPPVREPPAFTS